jgi:hypothetical protein
MTTGTHDISSLLAVRFQSVNDFGINSIEAVLRNDVAAHNQIVQSMMDSFVEFTTDSQRIYGTSVSGEMVEVDEYGRGPTQRNQPGATVGFPLRRFQWPVGWTEDWFAVHTPAEMAEATLAGEGAHWRRIYNDIKRAIYPSANYTFRDFLVNNVDLAVKRLVNADGASIPNGPNGETFNGATHTHYLARAGGALAASDVTGAINHVVEHGHGGAIKIAIASGDETAWRALTGFQPYVDPRMIYRNTDTPAMTLDITRLDNRAIGIIGAAEVWVKPWAIANYAFVWDNAGPKTLAYRQRTATALQGLRIAATLKTFPLVAEYMQAEYGIGVWNRTNGAVLYYGGTSYTDPAIL